MSPAPSSDRTAGPHRRRADADEGITVPATQIHRRDVDQDALRVISRLRRSGHEAYLVGGCVRDLLLGRKPKDFDVATSADPRTIKRLFRNGRIIGRRFKLVHVVYGGHVIETSTFRSEPTNTEDEDDLLIREDNEFGSAAEDARRRDFTINGLFLDPFEREIHDWVDGLEDLDRGVLRTIGDPERRMAEDPVRILRAIKFATRLGFRIEDATWSAMRAAAPELRRCAAPRVLEEILRLMRSGTALGAFRMMRACDALSVLLPNIDAFLGKKNDPDPDAHDRADSYWRLLEALDSNVHGGERPSNTVLLAVLFLRLIERRVEEAGVDPGDRAAWMDLADEEIEPIAREARFPRRAVEAAKRILVAQRRFTQPSTKSRRPMAFLRSNDFPEALHLFGLRSAAWGQGWDLYEAWKQRHERYLELPEEERPREPRRRRRRRSRGSRAPRRGGSERSSPPSAETG